MFKVIITVLFALVSAPAIGGCDYMAEHLSKSLYLDISDGGCRYDQVLISFTRKIKKDQQPDYASVKRFPFSGECEFGRTNQRGVPFKFFCRTNGNTPLAGATFKYKLVRYVHKFGECGDGPKKGRFPVFGFVCVAGCTLGVPKVLDELGPC
jgi:hypothetical protein